MGKGIRIDLLLFSTLVWGQLLAAAWRTGRRVGGGRGVRLGRSGFRLLGREHGGPPS